MPGACPSSDSLPPISLIWRETGTVASVFPHGGHPFQAERQPVRLLGKGLEVHEYLPFLLQAGFQQGGLRLAGGRRSGSGEQHPQACHQDPAPDRAVNRFRNHPVHHQILSASGYRHRLQAQSSIGPFGQQLYSNSEKKKGPEILRPLFFPLAGIRKIPAILSDQSFAWHLLQSTRW